MPAVSVVMPAYNVEPYIGDAIQSVLAQTFTDFELLIIDDGSTDETFAVAQRYADLDSRVRIIRQENKGLSAARNTALRNSRAPILALLDSDDLWTPAFLASQMAILDSHPEIDIVSGNAWTLGGRENGTPARPSPDPRRAPDLEAILSDEQAVFIMSVFRRRVYEVIGGFDETLRTNEDFDFWLRAAIAGFRFIRNDQPLGYYRRRDDSLSANPIRMLRGALRVYHNRRPALLYYTNELLIMDAQIRRFEAELMAAEARDALDKRDFLSARQHLTALADRRGGPMMGIVKWMARWTPGLLWKAYQVRRNRQAAQET